MADDTNQQGAADRSQVAAGEGYEVAYFAKKHNITEAAARALISQIGNDREKLDAAAEARSATVAKTKPRRSQSSNNGTSRKTAASARATRAPATSRKTAKRSTPGEAVAATTPAVSARGNRMKAGAKTIVTAARRSTETARRRVAAAPAAVGKQAGRALDATKTAATSRAGTLIGAAAAGLMAGLAIHIGRKAVVQAPSVFAGDWLEALKAEHALALSIFDKIENTSDAEPAKRAILLTQLKHALGKHAFTEENVIYPALRDWGDKADADKLNHDHGYVKQYLYELDALDNSSPAFLARISAFRADLEAHIREEEDAVFPPLHAALGEEKNAEITALANKEGFKLA